jgi:malate dehydrogenase (oxaloacetate-decarboxylating)(NADP+)
MSLTAKSLPYHFRGALDSVSTVNDAMLLAATEAIAGLAHDPIPASVRVRYGTEQLAYGANCLIPKPFDPRVLLRVAHAVAGAAIQSGVAGQTLDLQTYPQALAHRLGQPNPEANDLTVAGRTATASA